MSPTASSAWTQGLPPRARASERLDTPAPSRFDAMLAAADDAAEAAEILGNLMASEPAPQAKRHKSERVAAAQVALYLRTISCLEDA